MRTRHVLGDGTAVVVRPIEPEDKEALQLGLHRLSAESVQRRFLAPKPRLTRAELRYLTEVDGHDHAAFVAELADEPGTLVGVGRYVRLTEQPEVAEAAIVVADFLQRRGLGTLLARALATTAVGHGIERFTAVMQGDNAAARALMDRLVGELERRQSPTGTLEASGDLPA